MDFTKKTGILVVSFGTSHSGTRKVTIDAIEDSIREAFPEAAVYRAWTSGMILAKLKARDHIHYDNVKEAMERMASDGVTDVVVQPTHVINGIENDKMKEDVLAYRDRFAAVSFGAPLLTSEEDNAAAVQAVADEFHGLKKSEALVLMGHGTTHYANSVYAALDYRFKDMGYPNIFLGTVEAYPSMQQLLRMVKEYHPERVYLAPFMIVAGDHAKNDMAGDDQDSWLCQFENAGFAVTPVMKGLGEYKGIRRILIDHVREAVPASL